MRIPIPIVLVLCAASAGVAFLLGRRGDSGDNQYGGRGTEEGSRAGIPGVTGKGESEDGGRVDSKSDAQGKDLLPDFRRVYAQPFAPGRVSALRKLISRMDLETLREAWAEIDFSDVYWVSEDEWEVADAVLVRWLALDHDGAIAFVEGLPAMQRPYACWALAGEMAKTDPDAAIAYARGLPDGDERRGSLSAIVDAVAARSVDDAWAIILRAMNEKWSDQLRSVCGPFLDQLSKSEPLRALGMMSELSDPILIEQSIGRALGSLARKQPSEALRWLEEHRSEAGEAGNGVNFGKSIMAGWAGTDPVGAARYAAEHPEKAREGEWLKAIAEEWSDRDFDSALHWIQSLGSTEMREGALGGLISTPKLISNPERLADIFKAFPDSPEMQSKFNTIAFVWSKSDPVGGLEWAKSSESLGQNIDAFRGQLIETWARRDPMAAATHLGEIADARLSRSAAGRVAREMAKIDLSQATAWAAAQEPGPILDGAVEGLAAAYARRDMRESSAWLDGIPAGAIRDAALGSFVRALPVTEVSNAWDWAARIGDPIQRSVTLEAAAEKLLQANPVEGARRIRESSELSEEAKWRLLERPPIR